MCKYETTSKWRKCSLVLIRWFRMEILPLGVVIRTSIWKIISRFYLQLSTWIFLTALDGIKNFQLLISITSLQPVKFSTSPEIWDGGRKRGRGGKREKLFILFPPIYYSCYKLVRMCNQIAGLIYSTYW